MAQPTLTIKSGQNVEEIVSAANAMLGTTLMPSILVSFPTQGRYSSTTPGNRASLFVPKGGLTIPVTKPLTPGTLARAVQTHGDIALAQKSQGTIALRPVFGS